MLNIIRRNRLVNTFLLITTLLLRAKNIELYQPLVESASLLATLPSAGVNVGSEVTVLTVDGLLVTASWNLQMSQYIEILHYSITI